VDKDRSLLAELRHSTGLPASRTPERRWAAVFKAFIQPLLSQLLHPGSGKRTWSSAVLDRMQMRLEAGA